MAAVEKSNDWSAATADAEDEKNEAAGHDEEVTCNSKCPPVRRAGAGGGRGVIFAYATASLARPTIEDVIVKEEEEEELTKDDDEKEALAVAVVALPRVGRGRTDKRGGGG